MVMKNFKIVFVMALMCLFASSVKAQSIGDILKGVVGSVVAYKEVGYYTKKAHKMAHL